MIEMRISKPEEVSELQELFRLCFGDGPECSGLHFDCHYRPEKYLVLREDDVLAAAAGLRNVTLTEPDGRTVKAAYLYGVGTHPDRRGRGFAAQLMNYTDFYLHGKRDCVISASVHKDLHVFFAKVGFTGWFCFSEGEPAPRAPFAGEFARPVFLRRLASWPTEGTERMNCGMIKWYDPIAARRWAGTEGVWLGPAPD